MTTIAAFLMGMVGPLVLRALTMLGIGLITFTGVTAAVQGLIDLAVSSWGGIPGDVLALAGLAGIPACLGIICGAYIARTGMWVAVSATRWIVGA